MDDSANRLGQHVLLESEIHELRLKPLVLVHELAHWAHFGLVQVSELVLPDVERRFAEADLPAHVGDRRPGLDLPQDVVSAPCWSCSSSSRLLPAW